MRGQTVEPRRCRLAGGRGRPVLGGCQDFLHVHALTRYKDPRAFQMGIAPAISGIDVLLASEACELPICHSLIVVAYRSD